MDWSAQLETGEEVRWEGRPAPRCFTFRNWRHSLFGMLLLVLAVWWQAVGLQLAAVYGSPMIRWIPLPFLLLGLYLSLGHVLLARYEWEGVFYAVTDRRVLAQRGIFRRRLVSLALAEVTWFQVKPLGRDLAAVRIVAAGEGATLVLSCIEHPRRLTELLEAALAGNGALADQA